MMFADELVNYVVPDPMQPSPWCYFTKSLQRSVFSPSSPGSSRWRGPAVPVLTAGEVQRLLGTDQG